MRLFIATAAMALFLPVAAHAEWTAEANVASVEMQQNYYYRGNVTGAELGVGYNLHFDAFRVTPVAGAFLNGDDTVAYGKLEAVYQVTGQFDIGLGARASDQETNAYITGGTKLIRGFVGADYYGVGLRFGF